MTTALKRLLLLTLVLWLPVGTANQVLSEQAVKAALLLKLTKFVYLPQEQQDKLSMVCVLGENPFDSALESLVMAATDDRQVQLVYHGDAEQMELCQFVFVARSEARNLAATLKQLQLQQVVTISDIEGFARRGGMVELALDKSGSGQIRILINRKAASAQGVEFNAQLLRLATVVNH